jgi:aspartyl-tRNA(Asn)/glutamyl-tRNA(Gln) amidotransferase subunit C
VEISKSTIRRVAALARLKLSEEEEKELQIQLAKILDYMDILSELDLENVLPTAHTLGFLNKTRRDEIHESFAVEKVAEIAPQWEKDHIVVPRIV